MPKAAKSNKVDERPSPMKSKKIKEAKPIKSKNNKLPRVTVGADEMEKLQALSAPPEDTNQYQLVDFNGIFIRQDEYGRFLFKIPDSEYEELDKVLNDDMGLETQRSPLSIWKDQYQIRGKLSKEYMSQYKIGEIPIPVEKSAVKVEGQFVKAVIDGENVYWFSINKLSAVA